jgi:hypothetical protein
MRVDAARIAIEKRAQVRIYTCSPARGSKPGGTSSGESS